MLVQDNFLPEKQFKDLRDVIMGSNMPWFYNKRILEEHKDETAPFQFTHTLFNSDTSNAPLSEAASLFYPLFEQMGLKTMLKAKLNCGIRTSEHIEGGWHTDTPEDQIHKTAVFFFNTNNGYTKFEDGTIVESVENRLAEFDSNLSHTGVSHTDTQVRVVLNLNYLQSCTANFAEIVQYEAYEMLDTPLNTVHT